jgi:hypothetical protein
MRNPFVLDEKQSNVQTVEWRARRKNATVSLPHYPHDNPLMAKRAQKDVPVSQDAGRISFSAIVFSVAGNPASCP